nr:hypothetical protein [Desulfuromonas sp. TF]
MIDDHFQSFAKAGKVCDIDTGDAVKIKVAASGSGKNAVEGRIKINTEQISDLEFADAFDDSVNGLQVEFPCPVKIQDRDRTADRISKRIRKVKTAQIDRMLSLAESID